MVASALVYAPLLGSYFFADDLFNFTRIADRGCARFALEPMAGHVLVARNLLMCLHFGLFGLDAQGYFAVVLATHLLNVCLLFRVLRLLTGRRLAASIGALLWGTSPLHAEPLGWYAVYGHVLSATALLGALALVLPPRPFGDRHPSAAVAAASGLLLLLGATCFGTGLAIAVTAPLAVMLIAPAARRGGARAALLGTSLATPLLYFGLRWLARWIGDSSWQNDLALSMAAEHLDAVPVILVGLLRQALLGIVAGPWAPLAGAAGPWSWGLPAAAALALAAAVVRADAAARRAIVATLLLALAVYGVIALGRSWGGPDATATVQRYHYAGSAVLTLCLATAVVALARRRWTAWIVAGLALVAVDAWGLYRHPVWIRPRAAVRQTVDRQLARVAAAAQAAPPGATVYLENQPLPTPVAGVFARHLLPGTAALALVATGSDRWQGRELRFWDVDPPTRRAFRPPSSRWLSRMLVTPGVDTEASRTACQLRSARQAMAFVRRLLRCERQAAAGAPDLAACQAAAQAVYDRTVVGCGTCFDPKRLGQRLRAQVDGFRGVVRYMAGPDAPRLRVRCSAAALAASGSLIDDLFACHRTSILRDRRLDDLACGQQATEAYRARLDARPERCGAFAGVIGPIVELQVGIVFADVLCGSLGPPVAGAAAGPAPP